MTREMVQGIVTYYDRVEGNKVLGLGMPRPENEAQMTFNLEWILENWFMGKNITIVVNDEKGDPSIDEKDIQIIREDELAKSLGVV